MSADGRGSDFRHTALFYAGEDGFLAGTVPFVRAGLEAGEPVLVMVREERIAALRSELGPDAREVDFADMAEVGANPARIIPAWRSFVSGHEPAGGRLRGIGEPIWAGRSPAELAECQRHEALLNVAFAEGAPMDLLCPYDEVALAGDVLEAAHHHHPSVRSGTGEAVASTHYIGLDRAAAPFARPLHEPPPDAPALTFDRSTLDSVRTFAVVSARGAGLGDERCEDIVIALNELASNSVRHGGGSGTLRIWQEPEALVAEVADHGRIDRPLAGRVRPAEEQVGGHGLWLVHQLCDLVQMRTLAAGSVVRVHVRLGER